MSTHFHAPELGCELYLTINKRYIKEVNKYGLTKDWYCATHDCYVCRCGWEYGYHYHETTVTITPDSTTITDTIYEDHPRETLPNVPFPVDEGQPPLHGCDRGEDSEGAKALTEPKQGLPTATDTKPLPRAEWLRVP